MKGTEAFLAMAEWAEDKALFWSEEAYRLRGQVGGSLHRIKHHGASRLAHLATVKMEIYQECAATARRMAAEEGA